MTKKTYDRMNFYTTGRLGESRETTPEGFMLCRNVAIARTGTQLYGAGEVPVDPGPDGIIRIQRLDEEVFRAETIASFEGKPVTVEHPNEFVTPETWQTLAVGIVQNPRRGEGINNDLLIADLLITASDAIAYVDRELPELSAGYEADYLQTEPGRGVQQNIVGNHVALVERGRAGPRCSINDKEPDMANKSVWERIRRAFKSKDEAALEEALKEGESNDSDESEEDKKAREEAEAKEKQTSDAIAALMKTVDGLAAQVKKLTKDSDDPDDEEEAKKKKAEDEAKEEEEKAQVGDAMRDIAVRAEILVPGFSMPTTDSVKSMKSVSDVHRRVLAQAITTADTKKLIEPLLAGRTIDALSADAVATVFVAASESVKAQNNANGVRHNVTTKDFGRPSTIASINQRNAEFWATRKSQ